MMQSPVWLCRICGETHQENFYKQSRKLCRACTNRQAAERWVEKKKWAIQYLGGKCQRCGYDGYYGAMHFHHRNPQEKDMEWRTLKYRPLSIMKLELDKCDLLCNRCHMEVHGELNG